MAGAVQRAMVEAQAREALGQNSTCPQCQSRLRGNGTHRIHYRIPFGRLELDSPPVYRCRCQTGGRVSFSPLALWLGTHTSPELQYLEAQFAALLPYGVCARLLGTVLPLERATRSPHGSGMVQASVSTWIARLTSASRPLRHSMNSGYPSAIRFKRWALTAGT
jgi:hypothetical protein